MKKIISIVVLVLALLGVGIAYKSCGSPSIKANMKEMKQHYKDAMDANSMTELSKHAALLETTAQTVAKQDYDGTKPNEAIYKAGMVELSAEMTELRKAVADNDLDKAKKILSLINDTKKKYHTVLGV